MKTKPELLIEKALALHEQAWKQGERSRIFLARALLQGGDAVLLDESFAALDPDNMRQCLECVFRRARTLLVIAHP